MSSPLPILFSSFGQKSARKIVTSWKQFMNSCSLISQPSILLGAVTFTAWLLRWMSGFWSLGLKQRSWWNWFCRRILKNPCQSWISERVAEPSLWHWQIAVQNGRLLPLTSQAMLLPWRRKTLSPAASILLLSNPIALKQSVGALTSSFPIRPIFQKRIRMKLDLTFWPQNLTWPFLLRRMAMPSIGK